MLLTAVLAAACTLLPRGFARVAISDIVAGLLMLAALFAFAFNGMASKGRVRWFWMLQAAGWALWFSDQVVWITFDLVLRRKLPGMYPADALLFLAGAPMMAGLLLRPHRQPTERSARLGALDFFLLLLWWFYLYVSFVISWQYISPNEGAYNLNFDLLTGAETILLACVLLFFWREGSGRWRMFYACFCGVFLFSGVWFYILNVAIERDVYFTGSWYDVPYSASFALFSAVALLGPGLQPTPDAAEESYSTWMTNLAMVAVLSLPIFALYALLDSHLPDVSQALRSHADGHDPHTRDLVFYLIDADNFKEVNDRYGHDVGDKVLVEMARRLSSSIRHSDVLVRWGGEEFLIVSRYTDRSEAALLAQRVLSAVADTPIHVGRLEETMYRTCSLGWAAFPWPSTSPQAMGYEEVLTLADRGLHRAKELGKNRAVGIVPATGTLPAMTIEGLHSGGLKVDLLAVAGPVLGH